MQFVAGAHFNKIGNFQFPVRQLKDENHQVSLKPTAKVLVTKLVSNPNVAIAFNIVIMWGGFSNGRKNYKYVH